MGFFSEIASEARRSMAAPVQQTAAPPPAPAPAPPVAALETPAVQPVPAPPAPVEASTPPQEPPQAEPAPSAHTPPPPEVKLSVEDAAQALDDTAARQAHESAEAERKAKWDAKQAEKRAKRQAALDRIKAMNDAELLAAAVGRVAADTERLTRRNMREAVAEYIQSKCREDAAFAMLVLDPDKSMVSCFQYINRKAQEYAEQEMKDNGIERRGVYGLDVPDGLCFQWAEDYFKEDHKNDDETFTPKPFVSAPRKKTQGKTAKKSAPAEKSRTEKPSDAGMEQLTLGVM